MASLLAMGFSQKDSAGALAETGDDVRRAIELLLGGYQAPAPPEPPEELSEGDPPELSQADVVTLESTDGDCPETMVPRGGVTSSLSVSGTAEFSMPVPGGATTAAWSIDEADQRQVDVLVLFLPEGSRPADPAGVAYRRHTSCYGSYSTDQA